MLITNPLEAKIAELKSDLETEQRRHDNTRRLLAATGQKKTGLKDTDHQLLIDLIAVLADLRYAAHPHQSTPTDATRSRSAATPDPGAGTREFRRAIDMVFIDVGFAISDATDMLSGKTTRLPKARRCGRRDCRKYDRRQHGNDFCGGCGQPFGREPSMTAANH